MPIGVPTVNASVTTATKAARTKEMVRLLRDVINIMEEINDINQESQDGIDFTLVETLHGLSTDRVDPAKSNGQLYLEMVDAALKAINGVETNAQCLALIKRVV